VLVAIIERPVRRTGFYAVRGHRIFPLARAGVRGIDVTVGERRFSARRSADGWQIDGRPAKTATAEALNDLTTTLTGLRAVDTFRSADATAFGLDHPRATIELVTVRGVRRLVVGDLNSAGSAFYARRIGDPRVLQVGTLLQSELERVFYTRDGPRRAE